ncbi:MAG TPA: hypothetical protein VLA59_06350 [Patescibacteria group bacterium]|nr:hypothetical protein [Patescibacteria group bacterium]
MRRRSAPALLILTILAACVLEPSASPAASPDVPTASAAASEPAATPSPSEAAPSATSAPPTPTPEPSLSLDLPEASDPRTVTVQVDPAVPADGGGQIVVTVTSAADTRIDELVLRWPAELNEALFLAPFAPSEERIRDGGPPLEQPWTKWVVGPGERGEPAGTISLGWGPLLAGATLTIPILVTRLAPGPVAFDLQVLAGNDLLTLDGGAPAELRIEIP